MWNWVKAKVDLARSNAREAKENALLAADRRREQERILAAEEAERTRIEALKRRYWQEYQAFEEECFLKHRGEADRRFPTGKLGAELHRQMSLIRADLEERYGRRINEMRDELQGLSPTKERCRERLAVFERPYKTELAPLYSELNDLRARKQQLYVEKSAAHAALRTAKRNIEDWHSKSKRTPWLFGNGGKPLPKHSLFGQSFGDLDGYKADRSAAVAALTKVTEQIAVLDSQFHELNGKLSTIQACRQQMFDLRAEGIHPGKIRREISHLEERERSMVAALAELTAAHDAALEAAKAASGVTELAQRLTETKAAREAYIADFHSAPAQAIRKSIHRNEWIMKYGNEAGI